MTPQLVVAGNLLVDDLVHHDGSTRMGEPGGGALYVSISASLWGVKVGLVSLLGDDYPEEAIDALRTHAVDLEGVRRVDGPSLRTWLLYERTGRQIVRQLGGPSHAAVSPTIADVPEPWLGATLIHVCPTPFDVQRRLVEDLARRGAKLSLDPHEPVRDDNLADWSDVFTRLELFFVSHEEVRIDPRDESPDQMLRSLRGHFPRRALLLKCGGEGGIVHDVREGREVRWQARTTRVADATGAGDAFAGGFLAGWIRGEPVEQALRRAVVSASFAIESWGPAAIIAATPAAAERRLRDWFGAEVAA